MNWIENLKRIMKNKDINIEILKNLIENNGYKLSRNSISNILNGKNNPKVETIQHIAKALKIEVWEIFSGISDSDINGFIEFNGEVYRIKSRSDLEKLISKM